jgi:DNA-binding MarR family transcriptional regulator
MDVRNEDLFERMFAVHHRTIAAFHQVAAFEEWAALEILALRLFERSATDLGAIDIARTLGISFPHASRIAARLKKQGLVSERRWKQYRSLRLTAEGKAFLARELQNFSAFADEVFRRVSPADRRLLDQLLERIRNNVSAR